MRHFIRGLRHEPETQLKTACFFFVFCLSLYIMMCFVFSSDFLGMGERSPQAMMEGTAIRPHVYRQFVPAIARALVYITPDATITAITQVLHDKLWRSHMFSEMVRIRHPQGAPHELDDARLYPLVLLVLIDYSFLLGYFVVLWGLAKELFPRQLPVQLVSLASAAVALPAFCGKFGYMYDFPVLFFCALLTLLLVRKQILAYCFVLALATLNKETSAYLILVYYLYGHKILTRQSWLFYGILQVLIFANIKLAVDIYYQQQPGSLLDFGGFLRHLNFGRDGYSIYTLLGMGAAFLLFTFRWEEKPQILRYWLGLLPFIVLAWLFFGNRNEYRVFYEIFPALALLSGHTLVSAARWKKS